MQRYQDSNLDKAVENTHRLYSVRNTPEPLQLKVRSVPCLCPPCIHENGQCKNAVQTDPWKLVTLIPAKDSNKNKYKKQPRPDVKNKQRAISEQPQNKQVESTVWPNTDSETTVSYNGIECSDKEVEDEEITLKIHDEEESKEMDNSDRNQKKKATNSGKSVVHSSEIVTDDIIVTDSVTDNNSKNDNQPQSANSKKSSWVNVSEEINENDFLSSDSLEEYPQDNDVKIIDLCQRRSKEFELSLENILPTMNACSKVRDVFKQNLPKNVIWSSILTALHECKDYNKLEELCHELKNEMPPLKPRVQAVFSPNFDTVDDVAQGEIPPDRPRRLTVVFTIGDGNCLTRSTSHSFFNTDSRHLEIRAQTVVQGVVNKEYYLNDDCLQRGATYLHKNADLPMVFTTYSEYYTPGQRLTDDSISCIYSLEIHSIAKEGTYMGLWQLAQLSSVLSVPVHTIYPI